MKKGANVNERDAAGKTPLDYANRYGHEKVAKLLKSSGAEGKIDPKHFGFSPYLKKALKEGDAYAWYMGHAGYAVKTIKPKTFLASGGDSTEFVLLEVASTLEKYKDHTKIFCPEHRGDMFILKN